MIDSRINAQGVQFVVDHLANIPRPDREANRLIRQWLAGQGVDIDPDRVEVVTLHYRPDDQGYVAAVQQTQSMTQALLGNASELLSAMSRFVGVVSVPRREQFAFRYIDFVPLDGQRVMAILVFADNDVQNRVIETRRVYERSELERIANYLNTQFAGRPLSEIRANLLHDLRRAQTEMEGLLAESIELAEQALTPPGDDVVLAGQTRLMGVQELSDLERLRDLFEAFARKREILQLLDRTLQAPGVRVFIGEETGLAPLDGCTVVTAPYVAQGRVLGVLGVIGPTRMAYERVIPIVDVTAKLLSSALSQT